MNKKFDMNGKQIDKSQLNSMIDSAAGNLGGNADALKNALNNGSLDDVLKSLKPEDAAKVQAVMSDKGMAQKILSSPQALQMISKFFEGKK